MLTASGLSRLPNLVLPIFAARIFDVNNFSIFAVAYATASSVTAFLGEAIAATISRESHKNNNSENGKTSLSQFYVTSVVLAYVTAAACVLLYYLIYAKSENHVITLTTALVTIFLMAAYLLPAPTSSLSLALNRSHVSVNASLLGVPASLIISLYLGYKLGTVYFSSVYSLCIIMTCAAVFFVLRQGEGTNRLFSLSCLKVHGHIFLPIFLSYILGGPVHGLCMAIVGHQPAGLLELGKFVAYYPLCIAVSIVPGLLSNYFIQRVAEFDPESISNGHRGLFQRIIMINGAIAVVNALIIYTFGDIVLNMYGQTIPKDINLATWILVCGIGLAMVGATSQIMIGIGISHSLLKCAIAHACTYTVLTYIFVYKYELGAVGLAISLCISLFNLFILHSSYIHRYLKSIYR